MIPVFATKEKTMEVLGVDAYQFAHLCQHIKMPKVVLFIGEYYVLPLVVENVIRFMREMAEGVTPKVMADSFEDLVFRFAGTNQDELAKFIVPKNYLVDAIREMGENVTLSPSFVRKLVARHSGEDSAEGQKTAKSILQLFTSEVS